MTRDKFTARLKAAATKSDPNGYYAARILCDILPTISQLHALDSTAASTQLKEAKALGIQKADEGIDHAP